MNYRLIITDKLGNTIHSQCYESDQVAFEELRKFDLVKFQVTLEKIDGDAKTQSRHNAIPSAKTETK
jgi:hypothetical protein